MPAPPAPTVDPTTLEHAANAPAAATTAPAATEPEPIAAPQTPVASPAPEQAPLDTADPRPDKTRRATTIADLPSIVDLLVSPNEGPLPPAAARPTAVTPPRPPSPPAAAEHHAMVTSPPANVTVLVHYRGSSEGSQMEADRLAARLGTGAEHAEMRPETDVPQQAAIRYFAAEDHGVARELGHELGDMGYTWHIENFTHRDPRPSGTLEVWLPEHPTTPAHAEP